MLSQFNPSMEIVHMKKWSLALLLPVVLWSTTASAAIVTYSSEAAWMTAVSGMFVTEPFNNAGLQPSTGVFTSVGQIQADHWHDRVTVSGGESTTFSYLLDTLRGAGGTWDTSPAGEGQALGITLNMTGGGTQFVAQIGPIGAFFGWTSDAPFDSFTINAGYNSGVAETFDLDNLRMAPSGTPTPEPATLALVATALVGIPFVRRQFRSRS